MDVTGGAVERPCWADVRAHGATGNPAGDDTTAIQSAIDSLAVGGGVVCFPPGTYRISSTLTLAHARLTLLGGGRSSVIRATSGSFHLFEARADELSFERLAFEGAAGDETTRQFAIHTQASTPATSGNVVGCYFGGYWTPTPTHFGLNNGIVLDRGSHHWRISANMFDLLVGHDGNIGNGYGVLLSGSNEHQVAGNRFRGDHCLEPPRGRHAIYVCGGSSRNLIVDNHVSRFNSSSIAVYSTATQPPNEFNRIVGNVLIDQAPGENGTAAIELTGNVENTTVECNTIVKPGRHGVILEDAGAGGGNWSNRICSNSIYGAGQVGILVAGAKRAEIIDNVIINAS